MTGISSFEKSQYTFYRSCDIFLGAQEDEERPIQTVMLRLENRNAHN